MAITISQQCIITQLYLHAHYQHILSELAVDLTAIDKAEEVVRERIQNGQLQTNDELEEAFEFELQYQKQVIREVE